MHMIFTGNPGTGKTTIARLVAKYLKAIGALKGGQLVEVTRADLVGRYTGHTAPLTNSVIESALGGVLFIDEAYSLYRGEQDSFGLEAIDTLVKGMEDHRDELVVVLAGYTREMEVFLTANSGLASRFPNKIEFPDYTADELLDITNVLAKGKGYRLAEGCTFPLLGYYKRRQALDSRTAGNGRLARNTLEKAIFHQSRRLVAEPAAELDLILPSDLEFEERDSEWPPLRSGHAQRKNYLVGQQTPAGCGLPGVCIFTDGVVPESSIWRSGSTGQDGAVKFFLPETLHLPVRAFPVKVPEKSQIFHEPD